MEQLSSLPFVRLPKRDKQVILAVALCMLVLGFGAFSFAPAAHAASTAHTAAMSPNTTNGVELGFVSLAWYVQISGDNQNGTYILYPCFPISAIPPNESVLYGWWWKGPVTLNYYDGNGCNAVGWISAKFITAPTSWPTNVYTVNGD